MVLLQPKCSMYDGVGRCSKLVIVRVEKWEGPWGFPLARMLCGLQWCAHTASYKLLQKSASILGISSEASVTGCNPITCLIMFLMSHMFACCCTCRAPQAHVSGCPPTHKSHAYLLSASLNAHAVASPGFMLILDVMSEGICAE